MIFLIDPQDVTLGPPCIKCKTLVCEDKFCADKLCGPRIIPLYGIDCAEVVPF